MIVGDEFVGDDNELLKRVQHDVYFTIVAGLYGRARERYLAAARLLRVRDELRSLIEEKYGFDHRVLQVAHDRIAAWYRYAHDRHGQTALFPQKSVFGGKPLTHKEQLIADWRAFFDAESQALAETDSTAIAILEAVAYQNEERGYSAERRLEELLDWRYEPLTQARREFEEIARRRRNIL